MSCINTGQVTESPKFSDLSQRPPPLAQAKHLRIILESPVAHTRIQSVMTFCWFSLQSRCRIPPTARPLSRPHPLLWAGPQCAGQSPCCQPHPLIGVRAPSKTDYEQNTLCPSSALNPSRISRLTQSKLKVFPLTNKALPNLAPITCLRLCHCSPAPPRWPPLLLPGAFTHVVPFAWNPALSSLSSCVTGSMRPRDLLLQLSPDHVPPHIPSQLSFFSECLLLL